MLQAPLNLMLRRYWMADWWRLRKTCRRALLGVIVCLAIASVQAQAPAQVDDRLRVSIFFPGGSAYIVKQQAAKLAELLADNPDLANYSIQLQGHTDDIGNRSYNQRLSADRAAAVRIWLIEHGALPEAIEELPLGEDEPSFDNSTWEGKLSNRRVDVFLRPLM